MPLPKRFPNRDEIATVRAEADALEPDAEATATGILLVGRATHLRSRSEMSCELPLVLWMSSRTVMDSHSFSEGVI